MKKLLLLLFFLFTFPLFSQTLLNSYHFPRYNSYNYFWGITEVNGDFWMGSDYNAASGTYFYSWMYKVTKQGAILDSVQTPFDFNHGLAWDGTGFWIAEDNRTLGARLFKISTSGALMDSIILPSWMRGISGLAKEGDELWFAVYYPDNGVNYPNSWAYRVNINYKAITDSIPLRGSQVQGIAIKGDTIFYANDGFLAGDPERIYAHSRATGDTIFSFASPDPDNSCNPKGMYWDGQYLWLVAERAGGTAWVSEVLYQYNVDGAGTPIVVTPSTLSFNDVIIGAPITLDQIVQNTGTGELIVDSVRIDNPYFAVLNSTVKDTIHTSGFKNYQIKFSPAVYGDQTATLKIYSNDGLLPVRDVAVTARGVFGGPTLAINPSPVNFSNRRLNSTSSIEVTFTNQGSGVLAVSQLTKSTPNFYLEQVTTPFSIDSVQTKTFRVWFKPTAYSDFKDTLLIYSNAVNGNLIKLPLSGIGGGIDSSLGASYWQSQVPPNPTVISQNYQVRAMMDIDDVNNDGYKDLIVCSANYWIICFNGNSSVDGNILWKVSTVLDNNSAGSVEWIQNLYTQSDLNNDGIKDVVAGTTGGGESVFLINGKTGQVIWENGDPVNYDNGDIMGVDAKRDFNNDGVKDVLATASGNEGTGQGRHSIMCLNGLDGTPIWIIDQASEYKLKYSVVSTDFGGAAGSRYGTTYQVIGFDKLGNISWLFAPAGTPWTVREIPDIGGSTNSDVIVGTTTGDVYGLNGDNGSLLWQASISNVFIEDLKIVPDVNGDGLKDIAVCGISPSVYVLDGRTGNQVWTNYTGGNIVALAELGDLNGDGASEVATGTWQNNMLHIWDGKHGTETWSYTFGGVSGAAVDGLTTLGDLDGNLSKEFAAGTRDGRLYVMSGGLSYPTPVELTALSASVSGSNINIIWSTATELNNKGFSVERKTETGTYKEVVFVNGKGTSTEKTNYNVVDKDVAQGKYFYRLKQVDFDGTSEYSSEIEVNVGLPLSYSLEQNYPNPFNPSTTIKYDIPFDGVVKIKIYNTVGEEVAVIVNELQKAGKYQTVWNGKNISGNSVSSGIYFYKIEAGSFTATKKMMLLK